MRRRWWATALVAVSAALTIGCGGGEEDRDSGAARPPAPPAQSAEPQRPPGDRPETGRDDERPDGSGSREPSAEPEPGDGGDSGASGAGGGSGDEGSGGSVDPDQPDEEGNDVPPPAGSPAERFERFCEKNPRECF